MSDAPRDTDLMSRARHEAARRGDSHLSTGHLLLSWLGEERGPVAEILRARLGVQSQVRDVRRRIEQTFAAASESSGSSLARLPFSPALKTVLDAAIEERERLGARGPLREEHVLLALLSDRATVSRRRPASVATLLDFLGITAEMLREDVLSALVAGGDRHV